MPPETIAGRYRIEREVGRGGMGTVWLGRDLSLDRPVAVKRMGMLDDESVPDRDRALREARSAAALNHRNVVSVFDVVEDESGPWLVMEYVPSRTLAQILGEDGPLSPERAARIGADVAEGLLAAHRLGIIHRDVKPGNVLVAEDDAKISDFGIARKATDDTLTASGLVTGTPSYFSPELARGGDPGRESDVWALGVTLYMAVEGRPPYPRQANPLAMLQTIASQQPPRPERAGVLTEPIIRMMDPDPRSRWAMADAAHSLRRLAGASAPGWAEQTQTIPVTAPPEQAGPSTPPTPPPPTAAPAGTGPSTASRRRGALAAAVALVALLALGGVGYMLLTGPGGHTAASPPDGQGGSPGSSGSPTAGSPSAQSSPTNGPTRGRHGTAAGKSEFVDRYFAAMPGDTQTGWTLLSPGMRRDVGRGSYERFWGTVDSVSTRRTVPVPGEPAVLTTITYHMDNGRVVRERHRIALQRVGGRYLIARDQLLHTRTIRG